MKDCKIVTLYKNKGSQSDCNSYRGISLLGVVGKAFMRVVLNRLRKLTERINPESQSGFRSGRSTINTIFSLRQLQEKCKEQNRPLYITFIELTKAFDTVSRKALFRILKKIGCPLKQMQSIESFHTILKSIIQYNESFSQPFNIRRGVKECCALAPTHCNVYFTVMLKYAFW